MSAGNMTFVWERFKTMSNEDAHSVLAMMIVWVSNPITGTDEQRAMVVQLFGALDSYKSFCEASARDAQKEACVNLVGVGK